MELYELQELRAQNNRSLCTMISNDDDSKAHDAIISAFDTAQSELDKLIAVEKAKTVIYYKIVRKEYDSICEDLSFCVDSENDDDVFAVECTKEGVINMDADDYLACSGSEECCCELLDPESEWYEEGKPEWASHTRYEYV